MPQHIKFDKQERPPRKPGNGIIHMFIDRARNLRGVDGDTGEVFNIGDKTGALYASDPGVVVPATPTSTGTRGTVIVDADNGYRYECVATNRWSRLALPTVWA